jgi:hypothetical protein
LELATGEGHTLGIFLLFIQGKIEPVCSTWRWQVCNISFDGRANRFLCGFFVQRTTQVDGLLYQSGFVHRKSTMKLAFLTDESGGIGFFYLPTPPIRNLLVEIDKYP